MADGLERTTKRAAPHVDSGIIHGRPSRPVIWSLFHGWRSGRKTTASFEKSPALTGEARTTYIETMAGQGRQRIKKRCIFF